MKKIDLDELKNMSILCVEDEEGMRQSIVNTLEFYFDKVYESNDGLEGYDMYEYFSPKIILCDIQMKNMDGIELVKKIRQKDSSTIIIMLTAYSNEEYLLELINLNINHFIQKPINTKKLDIAFEKILSKDKTIIDLMEDFTLNLQKCELVYRGNIIISLRKREKDFLKLLYEKKDRILTYEQIEFELWDEKEMTQNALKSFIKELRNKLPIDIVKNISKIGYILSKK